MWENLGSRTLWTRTRFDAGGVSASLVTQGAAHAPGAFGAANGAAPAKITSPSRRPLDLSALVTASLFR
jgi:hypothetical protein